MLPAEQRLRSKAQLKEWLSCEKKRYGKFGLLDSILNYREQYVLYRHQVLLRKTEYLFNNRKPLWKLYAIRLKKVQNRHSIRIPLNTCAKGLRIMHLGPVLINEAASIGENCTFHMNTGVVAGGTDNHAPTLGKQVIIGMGAVLLGDIRIADGVAIGANAVVNKDVTEPNVTVAGVPAKKISNQGSADWNKKQ